MKTSFGTVLVLTSLAFAPAVFATGHDSGPSSAQLRRISPGRMQIGADGAAQRVELRRSLLGRVAIKARASRVGWVRRLALRVFKRTEYGRVRVTTFEHGEAINKVSIRARTRINAGAQDPERNPHVYAAYARYQYDAMVRPGETDRRSRVERRAIARVVEQNAARNVWRKGVVIGAGVGVVAAAVSGYMFPVTAVIAGTGLVGVTLGLRVAAQRDITEAGTEAFNRVNAGKVIGGKDAPAPAPIEAPSHA